jgi:hypothetical protein
MIKLLSFSMMILVLSSCKNISKDAKSDENVSTSETGNLTSMLSPTDSVSAEPYLFTDKNGLIYMSWIEKSKGKSWLKYSVLNNDNWSEPLVISSGENWFVNWADYPLLASDGGNSTVAHFLQKSETGKYTYDVMLSTSIDKGKTWSTPKILHDDGKKAEHGFVSMIPYGENYLVSWLDGRNAAMEHGGGHSEGHHGQMTIRAAIVDKQGNKSGEWELDGRVCDCCQTSAVMTTNGPIVVYRDRSDHEVRDISIVRMVDNNWTTPKSIHADNWKIDGCPVNGPRAAAIGNNLVVAWFSSPDKKSQVNIVFSKDGGATFDAPIRIDEGKGIGRVDVEMLNEKSAMVSWMEGSVIKAVKVYDDGRKDPSIIIASSSEARASGFPQMTKSGNMMVVAWTDDVSKAVRTARLHL